MQALQFRTNIGIIWGIAVLCCGAAFAQVDDGPSVNLAGGPVSVVTTFDLRPGTGPAQAPDTGLSGILPVGLAFYTASYSAVFPGFGAFPLPFNGSAREFD
jgi:hypothetical protein